MLRMRRKFLMIGSGEAFLGGMLNEQKTGR